MFIKLAPDFHQKKFKLEIEYDASSTNLFNYDAKFAPNIMQICPHFKHFYCKNDTRYNKKGSGKNALMFSWVQNDSITLSIYDWI